MTARVVLGCLVAGLCLFACAGDGDPRPSFEVEPDPTRTTPIEAFESERASCTFAAGDRPSHTLGIDASARAQIPITHVIVRMQENRSFDHILGLLPRRGHPEVDGLPEDASNPDVDGVEVRAFRLSSMSLEADPPHQWDDNVAQWNGGALDGYVRAAAIDGSNGHYVMGHYDEPDLPFYYWLARTYAISDRYFAASFGGTWSNRNFLYTGAGYGVKNTFDRILDDVPTIFDQLDEAGIPWGVFTDGLPRQDTLGWTAERPGVARFREFLRGLEQGTLPPVSFVDTPPWSPEDEHPPNDLRGGEAWARTIYEAATTSPLWPRLAMIFNYDNGGGLYDHVPPPEACVPAPGEEDFDRRGPRTPFFVISPWVRGGIVSHTVRDHSSVLRFIQVLHDLPALTARDANADALLEFFDFRAPALRHPPPAPEFESR